jgi:hypothetical protein
VKASDARENESKQRDLLDCHGATRLRAFCRFTAPRAGER